MEITCKDCGHFLGMDEGWHDRCEDCRVVLPLIQKIKDNLTDDLLKPIYRGTGRKYFGHCYVASECFYYLYGRDHGWKPYCFRDYYNDTHWWLQKDGEIIDITVEQFEVPYYYRKGHSQFFMRYPSKRCLILAERINKGT